MALDTGYVLSHSYLPPQVRYNSAASGPLSHICIVGNNVRITLLQDLVCVTNYSWTHFLVSPPPSHSKPSEQANEGFQPSVIELQNHTVQKRLEGEQTRGIVQQGTVYPSEKAEDRR